MKRALLALSCWLLLAGWASAATVTTFLEPGTDATQDLKLYATTGTAATSDTSQAHTGPRSLKLATGAGPTSALVNGPTGMFADTGSQASFWFRFDVLPAGNANIFTITNAALGNVFNFQLSTAGIIINAPAGATSQNGVTTLSVNTWYRLSFSYYVTNATTYQMKVYVNGALDSTTNAGTLTNITTNRFALKLNSAAGTNHNVWFDDLYVATGGASSGSQPDTGDIRVTAKLPFSNGTTNGFTGSGTPSGYGSGNARYVNERPLNTSNFVSVVGAGSAITEEYNVEAIGVGDVNVPAGHIVDTMGWIYAASVISETGSIVLAGVSSSVALTNSGGTIFMVAAGTTAYPAGSGTDIGIISNAAVTTYTLYECGVLVAFNPSACGALLLTGVGC